MPGLLLFGWAKPVPVTSNLRGGRKGDMWVSAAAYFKCNVGSCVCWHSSCDVSTFSSGRMTEHLFKYSHRCVSQLMLAILIWSPFIHWIASFLQVFARSFLPMLESINRYGFLIMIAGLYLDFKYLTI
jgi:hypothetical protein